VTKEEFATINCDWERGRLSGIPDCCIYFFTTIWTGVYLLAHDRRVSPDLRQKAKAIRAERDRISWGYVPCDSCIAAGNRIDVIKHLPGTRARVPLRRRKLRR
jgi:hypothetical protein